MSSPLSVNKNRKPRVTRAAEKNPPDRAGQNGGKLKTGNKGHVGAKAGRKPDAYKDFLAKVLTGEKHLKQVRAVLQNAKHPAFGSVYGKVLIHHLGIPKVTDGGEGESPHVSVDI